MHFYGWQKGLKTGMYYLRTRPATNAIKFTVDVEALLKQSFEGIEVNIFNRNESHQPNQENADKELSDVNIQKAKSDVLAEGKPAMAACPLRKRKKNEEGQLVEDDEECLACGS